MKVYNGRNKIIKLFEDNIIKPSNYPHNAKFEPDEYYEPEEYDGVEKSKQKFEEGTGGKTRIRRQKNSDKKDIPNKFNELVTQKDETMNKYLFKGYFRFKSLIDMQGNLHKTKNTNRNRELAQLIDTKLANLKKFESGNKNKKLDEMVNIVEEILDFNYYQNQEGQGLKILTPEQGLSRLPISLAQLMAGTNSEKHLKNEIRQLSYSLYRSKKLSKTIYKHLMNTTI